MAHHDHEPSDEALVERSLDGEADAFRALVERYHDPLICFLTRLMGDRAAAEDVFQETFLQLHQSLHTFELDRRLKPWLFTIATNKARDALRRKRRRPAISLDAPIDRGSPDGGSFVDLMAIDVPDASAGIDNEERSELVQRAIDLLSPLQREVLLLAYFQRMGYQHIAEVLDVPLGTVKSRLHGAVAAFARRWQEQIDRRKAELAGDRPGPAA